MEFIRLNPPRRLEHNLYLPDFGSASTGAISIVPAGNSTRVTRTIVGKMASTLLMHCFGLMTGDDRPQFCRLPEESEGSFREYMKACAKSRVTRHCVQNATVSQFPSEKHEKPLTFDFVVCILTTVSQGA